VCVCVAFVSSFFWFYGWSPCDFDSYRYVSVTRFPRDAVLQGEKEIIENNKAWEDHGSNKSPVPVPMPVQ
jgi:hypothetical protein